MLPFYGKIRKYMESVSRRYPALLILLTVIFAVLPFLSDSPWKTLPVTLWLIGIAFLFPLKNCCVSAVFALVACLSAHFTTQIPSYRDFNAEIVNSAAYGEFIVTIDDGSVSKLPDAGRPRYVHCRLDYFRLKGEQQWRSGQGATLGLFLPKSDVSEGKTAGDKAISAIKKKTQPLQVPESGYGDRLYVSGSVGIMREPALAEQFDYGGYLRHNGIGLIVFPREIELEKKGTGFLRGLYDFRDIILMRIFKSFSDDEAKALGAGILFGFGYNINHDTKEAFIRSGTIHILTVSGTHVGLFAAFVALLLCFLPLRTRAATVLALTFVYVFLTGMRAPSLRAYVMLAFLLGGKIFLLKTDAKNTLALAATFLILLNPFNLVSAGFHFSFLTVFAILLLYPLQIRINDAFPVDQNWVAARNVKKTTFFLRSLWRNLLSGALVAFVASLACLAISVFYQGIFPGSTMAANMLLLPIVWWCFPLAVLTAAFGSVFGCMLEFLLQTIGYLCANLGDIGALRFATPPVWSVFLFLILAFLFLYFPQEIQWRRKWETMSLEGIEKIKRRLMMEKIVFLMKIPLALLMFGILLWWYFRPAHLTCQIAVFSGGTQDGTVAVVVLDPTDRNSYILNLSDISQAKSIETFLKNRGITHCSDFVVEDGKQSRIGGLQYFKLPIWNRHLYQRQLSSFPEEQPRDFDVLPTLAKSRKDVFPTEGALKEIKNTRDLKILKSREQCVLILHQMDLEIRCVHLPSGETAVMADRDGKNLFYKVFPQTLYAEVTLQEI